MPIGLIIKGIIKQKKISVIDIANQLGVTRQAVYQSFSREKMTLEEKKVWADVLGVNISDLDKDIEFNKTSNDNNYLFKYIQELESRISKQDETISHLRRVNEVLLGKSASASIARFAFFLLPLEQIWVPLFKLSA